MGITRDRGRYYAVLRVPGRFADIVTGRDGHPISQVRAALHTDSRLEAGRKAARWEATKIAEWEALALGDAASAAQHYRAARELAAARGHVYTPVARLADDDIREIGRRLQSLGEGESTAAYRAVLGAVAEATPTLAEAFEEVADLTRTERLGKSAAQAARWLRARRLSVEKFDAVTRADPRFPDAPLTVDAVERAHALAFREHLAAKIERDGLSASAANRAIGHCSQIMARWSELTGRSLPRPFANLRLKGAPAAAVPPFSREWIETRLLAPGALAALNAEARDVFLVMVNTGLRPSEITDAPPGDFRVAAPIPHFVVAAHGRELKQRHTGREVPLLGVSLDAARRIAARGGIQRYADRAASWSAAVGKHLRVHGLRESDRHVPYSLRHAVEDALLVAGVDDRVRADILGHRYARPRYGEGGALPPRRAALEAAMFVPRSGGS